MRLIDADALMKTLGITDMDCEKCALRNKSYPVCNRGDGFADACSAIEDAPTIDERKKGEWVEKHVYSDEEGGIEEWQSCKCSKCGRYDTRPYMYYFQEPKYCSWCGAKMVRGEEDERSDQ